MHILLELLLILHCFTLSVTAHNHNPPNLCIPSFNLHQNHTTMHTAFCPHVYGLGHHLLLPVPTS